MEAISQYGGGFWDGLEVLILLSSWEDEDSVIRESMRVQRWRTELKKS